MRNQNRKFLSLTLFVSIFSGQILFAQDTNSVNTNEKNIVKMNVAALALKTYSFQYERAVGEKISVAMGFRVMPKSTPPLKSKIEDLIDNDETWSHIKDFKTGNFAITPEVRFFLGKSVFKGFYVAPFVSYAKYDFDIPFEYSYLTYSTTIPLSGSVNTFTGGIKIGAQWSLSKLVFLDWWIIGPNYGTSSGTISGAKEMIPIEQDYVRNELKDLDDIPLIKTTSTVDDHGVKIKVDGPWAGVRAGLNVGFRF